jgi:hypothetical protein
MERLHWFALNLTDVLPYRCDFCHSGEQNGKIYYAILSKLLRLWRPDRFLARRKDSEPEPITQGVSALGILSKIWTTARGRGGRTRQGFFVSAAPQIGNFHRKVGHPVHLSGEVSKQLKRRLLAATIAHFVMTITAQKRT